jgi:acetyl-CoA acetyltransferase
MAAEGDGASGLLIAGADRAEQLALTPMARLVSFATVGTDPLVWPAATVPASKEALDRAGLTADDIDWWEVHESSAVAVQVWLAEMKVSADKVNPTGGALASTAPLGAVEPACSSLPFQGSSRRVYAEPLSAWPPRAG